MHPAVAAEASEPIIIYRSVDRDGQTFGLHPLSMDRLRDRFGDSIHAHPRVFIAHETTADHQHLQTRLAAQVVALLTGVSMQRLDELGGVSFRDPVTDMEITLAGSSDAAGAVGELA